MPMAALNPKIRHTMIDGAVFQEEVTRREVMAVPAVFLNGEPFARAAWNSRRSSISWTQGGGAPAEKLNAKAPYDVLVVGAGRRSRGGHLCRAQAFAPHCRGASRGQLLDTVGIENFISVKETQGTN